MNAHYNYGTCFAKAFDYKPTYTHIHIPRTHTSIHSKLWARFDGRHPYVHLYICMSKLLASTNVQWTYRYLYPRERHHCYVVYVCYYYDLCISVSGRETRVPWRRPDHSFFSFFLFVLFLYVNISCTWCYELSAIWTGSTTWKKKENTDALSRRQKKKKKEKGFPLWKIIQFFLLFILHTVPILARCWMNNNSSTGHVFACMWVCVHFLHAYVCPCVCVYFCTYFCVQIDSKTTNCWYGTPLQYTNVWAGLFVIHTIRISG